MPRDANGNTQPLPGTIVSTGDTVLPSQHNPMVVDLYAMMTQSLSREGQGGMLANLNFSSFKGTNLANGTTSTDAVNKGQLDGSMTTTTTGGATQLIFPNIDIMVQFGSSVLTTDGSGLGLVAFPVAFSSVPTSIVAMSGSATAFAGAISVDASWTAGSFLISTNGLAPSRVIRINWAAIGAKV